MIYKERLLRLKLLLLEYRRDISDLVSHKCVTGQYHLNLDTFVQRKPYSNYLIRSHDPNNFVEFKCRTNYFYHSYFPRVVRAWNSLPSEIKETDTNLAFKGLLEPTSSQSSILTNYQLVLKLYNA